MPISPTPDSYRVRIQLEPLPSFENFMWNDDVSTAEQRPTRGRQGRTQSNDFQWWQQTESPLLPNCVAAKKPPTWSASVAVSYQCFWPYANTVLKWMLEMGAERKCCFPASNSELCETHVCIHTYTYPFHRIDIPWFWRHFYFMPYPYDCYTYVHVLCIPVIAMTYMQSCKWMLHIQLVNWLHSESEAGLLLVTRTGRLHFSTCRDWCYCDRQPQYLPC